MTLYLDGERAGAFLSGRRCTSQTAPAGEALQPMEFGLFIFKLVLFENRFHSWKSLYPGNTPCTGSEEASDPCEAIPRGNLGQRRTTKVERLPRLFPLGLL